MTTKGGFWSKIKSVKYYLRLLLPIHWLRNSGTNKHWDTFVLKQLENPSFEPLSNSNCLVSLNGAPIWVANYPYAYGSPIGSTGGANLPSRITVMKLKEAVDKYKEQAFVNKYCNQQGRNR